MNHPNRSSDPDEGRHPLGSTLALMTGAPISDDAAIEAARPHAGDSMATVYIIDSDVSVRESLESLIRSAGSKPEAFASAEEFLSRTPDRVPSCVIAELTLPGASGLELQQQLAARMDLPIIFITGRADVPTTVQAMKAGAVEVLTKPLNEIALLHAIPAAVEQSRAALRDDCQMRMLEKCYSSVTLRQREVMSLVVSGMLNKQIADELQISETTVKAHRGQVMRKMRAGSLPHLVTIAARLAFQRSRDSSFTPAGATSSPS